MTPKQKEHFNSMRESLRMIADFRTTDELRKTAESDYGLSYEEALEMAYENVLSNAQCAVRGIREAK